MSTNYYLTDAAAIQSGVALAWLKQVHIAHSTANGFLLQAVRGETNFSDETLNFDPHRVSLYYSPVSDFPTVENWKRMKELILDPTYVVVNEYGEVFEGEDFVRLVENDKAGTDSRYHRMTEWLENDANSYSLFDNLRTDYLDDDGFSFEVREFS